ncbi:MAG: segregation/condensation protein A [Patescibacteria group bacterium]
MLDVKLEQFEGPLELLVRLIDSEELPITEVSLASVTDQYLARLSALSSTTHIDDLADFLVVAARLLLIKSRKLLPSLTDEEEEEIHDLELKLKIYKEFAHAAKVLEKMHGAHRILFPRPARKLTLSEQVRFLPPPRLTVERITTAFRDVLKHIEPVLPKKTLTLDSRISVQEKIAQIKEMLSTRIACSFRSLVGENASRQEVVVSFLALLELVKQKHAFVVQDSLFEDIHIEPAPAVQTV